MVSAIRISVHAWCWMIAVSAINYRDNAYTTMCTWRHIWICIKICRKSQRKYIWDFLIILNVEKCYERVKRWIVCSILSMKYSRINSLNVCLQLYTLYTFQIYITSVSLWIRNHLLTNRFKLTWWKNVFLCFQTTLPMGSDWNGWAQTINSL